MIVTNRTWIRSTIETPWWTTIQSNDYLEYIKTKYKNTKKLLYTSLVASKDGLTLTSTTHFANQTAYDEFSNDPLIRVWNRTRRQYCIKYDIQESALIVSNDE